MNRICAAVVVAAVLLAGRPASAEIIDRILAVISGQIITKSDLDAAMALGLIDLPSESDRANAGLQSLIDRVLMLNEVRRVVPPEPTPPDVDARVAAIAKRAGSAADLTRILAASGIDESVLRIYAADDLRLAAYLDERFSGASQPTDEEVRQAGEGSAARLAAERRASLVSAWIGELRRRADITILPELGSPQ